MTTLKHLALIPDGNRRWAKSVNRGVLDGHRVVVDKVFPELVSEALALKLPYFTIWGFSTEKLGATTNGDRGNFNFGENVFN